MAIQVIGQPKFLNGGELGLALNQYLTEPDPEPEWVADANGNQIIPRRDPIPPPDPPRTNPNITPPTNQSDNLIFGFEPTTVLIAAVVVGGLFFLSQGSK